MFERKPSVSQDARRAQKIATTQKAEAAAAAVELADVSFIFGFKQYLAEVLEGLGHTIMFPLAAGASIIRAILRIREAYLERKENKTGAIVKAVVETLAALAITTAVVGTFAAATTFALVGPIIFTITLATKAAYHLSAAIYYGMNWLLATAGKQMQDHKEKMKNHAMLTVVSALTTIAAGLVLVAHKVSFGLLGLIGGALGALYAVYRALTIKPEKPAHGPAALSTDLESTELTPRHELSVTHSPSQSRTSGPSIIGGVSTTEIVTKTAQTDSAGQTQRPPIVIAPRLPTEQEAFDALKKALSSLETRIFEIARILEGPRPYLGAHAAFNIRGVGNDGQRMKERSTVHWENLLTERYASAAPHVRTLMDEFGTKLAAYNKLIKDNSELIHKIMLRHYIAADQGAKLATANEEARDAELLNKRGITKTDAVALGESIGLGKRYA